MSKVSYKKFLTELAKVYDVYNRQPPNFRLPSQVYMCGVCTGWNSWQETFVRSNLEGAIGCHPEHYEQLKMHIYQWEEKYGSFQGVMERHYDGMKKSKKDRKPTAFSNRCRARFLRALARGDMDFTPARKTSVKVI